MSLLPLVRIQRDDLHGCRTIQENSYICSSVSNQRHLAILNEPCDGNSFPIKALFFACSTIWHKLDISLPKIKEYVFRKY